VATVLVLVTPYLPAPVHLTAVVLAALVATVTIVGRRVPAAVQSS
jgi:hypothetical protein